MKLSLLDAILGTDAKDAPAAGGGNVDQKESTETKSEEKTDSDGLSDGSASDGSANEGSQEDKNQDEPELQPPADGFIPAE